MSHSQLTSDYPRYPSVYKASKGLTPADRLMLMVRTNITQCDINLLYLVSVTNGLCYIIIHTGSVTIHESVSVHHLPWGSTASGLQSLQDNGTQAPSCHARIRNCEWYKKIFFQSLHYKSGVEEVKKLEWHRFQLPSAWNKTKILCGQLNCLVKLADVSTRCSSHPQGRKESSFHSCRLQLRTISLHRERY